MIVRGALPAGLSSAALVSATWVCGSSKDKIRCGFFSSVMCPFLSNTVTSRNTKRELTRIVGTFEAPGCN
jgi:hypothetical protein